MATNDALSDLAGRIRSSVDTARQAALGLHAVLSRGDRLLRFDELVDRVREALKWPFYERHVGMRAPDVWVVVGPAGIPDDTHVVVEQQGAPRPEIKTLMQSGAVLRGADLLRQAPGLRERLAQGEFSTLLGRKGEFTLVWLKQVAGPGLPGRTSDTEPA